jgi:hypothetical protein
LGYLSIRYLATSRTLGDIELKEPAAIERYDRPVNATKRNQLAIFAATATLNEH